MFTAGLSPRMATRRRRRLAAVMLSVATLLVPLFNDTAQAARPEPESPFRTIITSDAEIDDVASFHRLLLHANDLAGSLEGIVYSSSTFHWAGDPTANPPIPAYQWAGTEVFQDMINGTGTKWGAGGGYAAIVDNLRRHDPRYPSVDHLNSLIKVGNISYRGEMQADTEGSDLIKQALLDDDPRPLHLQVWGGTNTIAAALRSIEDEYKGTRDWPSIYSRVVSKARVNIILDQDETYKDYIDPRWPDLNVIVNRDQFWTVAYFRYRYSGERGLPRVPGEIENAYFKPPFIQQRIRFGPLLSSYPVSADAYASGAVIYPNTDEFLSEGDSPSYFELLDNGLRSWEDPTYGGWGGRFAQASTHRWSDFPTYVTDDNWAYGERRYDHEPSRVRDAGPYGESYAVAYPQARWIPALQNELAARAEWQTKSYDEANHPPVVRIAGDRIDRCVRPGARVPLSARLSDPDGDKLTSTWWHYREAGTYPGVVAVARPSAATTSFVVPRDAKPGQTIHMILEVRDRAERPMTRYVRVIATVAGGPGLGAGKCARSADDLGSGRNDR
ncbi:DUF1593 domain-containing protein [Plantactinospora mayteni]|uniref:DUF1593 domain-containing protein n=1 Tax=Plantactinospora mayteni TaxID=566021 RepID=A0ABQ4F0M5_9ACTN|nr:DUF1593 domain-containing protein [Plantactinospora mayteni]GIH00476.1 hypothetical protein Pma05_70480 [Plantactinospora mayteni]